ncbi:MAG TPA: DinB family protein [Gemmatimonadales bacterium]|nr:DinB family protein [Gemmatimonadales bacterium]
MTFANPAGDAAAAAAGYTRALLELLGDRDPLAVAGELLPWLERRTAGLDDAVIRRPEAPGKWSVLEIIQHLADTEVVYAWRTRQILTQDRPAIQGYDQDAWARTLGYDTADLAVALGQLRGVRTANLRLWRSLTPAQLARVGLHSERGPESMDLVLRMMGAHDLVHRRQIDRVLAAAGVVAR